MFAVTWTGQCLNQTCWSPVLLTHTSTSGTSSKNPDASALQGNHWTHFHDLQLAHAEGPCFWPCLQSLHLLPVVSKNGFCFPALRPAQSQWRETHSWWLSNRHAADWQQYQLASLPNFYRSFLGSFSWNPDIFFNIFFPSAWWTSIISWFQSCFPLNAVAVADTPSVVGAVVRNLFLFVTSLDSGCFLSRVTSQ